MEFLSLASNPIGENVEEFVFANLTKLRHLNLRNISCPYFSSSMFEHFTKLDYLDLSENPIEYMPSLPTSIRVLYIGGTNMPLIGDLLMPQLRVLSMENSPNITSVVFNNFENLTQLEIMTFSNSERLSKISLHRMPFEILPKLTNLSLRNCNIETIDAEVMPLIQRIKTVDLRDNPWKCDCKLKWLAAMNLTPELRTHFR